MENLDFILCEIDENSQVYFAKRIDIDQSLWTNITPTNYHALGFKLLILDSLLKRLNEADKKPINHDELLKTFTNQLNTLIDFKLKHTKEEINKMDLVDWIHNY